MQLGDWVSENAIFLHAVAQKSQNAKDETWRENAVW